MKPLKNLTEQESLEYLKSLAIPYPRHVLVKNEKELLEVDLNYPLAMKISSPDIFHKTDVGGVLLDLKNKQEVELGFQTILTKVKKEKPDARIEGVMVLEQAPDGRELIVGLSNDPAFGKVIMVGIGGVFTELFKDVVFRVVPIVEEDAWDMIEKIRGSAILDGWRGKPPVDKSAIVKLLCDLSQFADTHPELHSLDLNPVRVYEEGLIILDVKATLVGE